MILLQTVTIFWLGGGHFSQLMYVHGFNVVMQTVARGIQPLVPEPSAFQLGMILTIQ